MSNRIDWWEVLDVFCWGIGKLAAPTFSSMMSGLDEDRYRTLGPHFWRKMEQAELVTRSGRGRNVQFTITEKGRQQCAEVNPTHHWQTPWDRRWRLVTFDLPSDRKKDRMTLWRELRNRRLGLLQRSVWIWPRDIEPILHEIIHANGIPECFAGFERTRLFLCNHEEVVNTSWDFEAIGRAHDKYLATADHHKRLVREASSLAALARAAKAERFEFSDAMERDPLLPRELWPKKYRGPDVWGRHEDIRSTLRTRFGVLHSKQEK